MNNNFIEKMKVLINEKVEKFKSDAEKDGVKIPIRVLLAYKIGLQDGMKLCLNEFKELHKDEDEDDLK